MYWGRLPVNLLGRFFAAAGESETGEPRGSCTWARNNIRRLIEGGHLLGFACPNSAAFCEDTALWKTGHQDRALRLPFVDLLRPSLAAR